MSKNNKRQDERTPSQLPIGLHFYGEQIDTSISEDVSNGGLFIRTDSVRSLDVGVVVLLSIHNDDQVRRCLAEVVRVTDKGAGLKIIEDNLHADDYEEATLA